MEAPATPLTTGLSRVPNYFRFIQWDITARCNLRCIHCRSESFYGSSDLGKDLPTRDVQRRLLALYQKGIRRIHFLGGEPFVRRDLPNIVRYATDLGILCSVNTNGTLLTEQTARAIIDSGVYLLTFSIDGCDAATNDAIRGKGTFARILRGIDRVHRAKAAVHGKTRLICSHVLMRPNLARVAGMVDLCTQLGLQNLIVTNLRRMGGAISLYEKLSVTEDDRLAAAEALAARLVNGAPHCHVQIEIVSLLAKIYLNAKYGLGLEIERGGCDAVASKAYVQPDGTLFPCQDVAKAVGRLEGRDRIKANGLGSWESSEFAGIATNLSSLTVYQDYRPCSTCPALGHLCTPCPLQGLRGERVVQSACSHILARAKREGIDLYAAVKGAARHSGTARLLQDPAYRRAFFTTDAPEAYLTDSCADTEERQHALKVRDEALHEFQDLLRLGLRRLADRAPEAPNHSPAFIQESDR